MSFNKQLVLNNMKLNYRKRLFTGKSEDCKYYDCLNSEQKELWIGEMDQIIDSINPYTIAFNPVAIWRMRKKQKELRRKFGFAD